MITKPLLEVKNLIVRYGLEEAVRGIHLIVPAGSIVTLIGPNGAGKTTALAALMGLLPAQGYVTFAGEGVGGGSVSARMSRGMILVPESHELFTDMTVRENLMMGAFLRHRQDAKRLEVDLQEVYRTFPRMEERQSQLAGTLSGGRASDAGHWPCSDG